MASAAVASDARPIAAALVIPSFWCTPSAATAAAATLDAASLRNTSVTTAEAVSAASAASSPCLVSARQCHAEKQFRPRLWREAAYRSREEVKRGWPKCEWSETFCQTILPVLLLQLPTGTVLDLNKIRLPSCGCRVGRPHGSMEHAHKCEIALTWKIRALGSPHASSHHSCRTDKANWPRNHASALSAMDLHKERRSVGERQEHWRRLSFCHQLPFKLAAPHTPLLHTRPLIPSPHLAVWLCSTWWER